MAEPESPEGEAPLDLGDRTSVRKNNKSASRKAVETEATVRSMLATPEQRAWWWEILGRCGVFRADLLPGDALQFATGQRNIGLLLLAAIPADLYHVMTTEARQEKPNA